jgi:hypothetical protein
MSRVFTGPDKFEHPHGHAFNNPLCALKHRNLYPGGTLLKCMIVHAQERIYVEISR